MEIRPIVEMKAISKHFGGVQALDSATIDLYEGEVLGIVGHNGAGKSTLIKILSGALQADEGKVYFRGKEAEIRSPTDARALGIETIYQHLALADQQNVPANVFLGRELRKRWAIIDNRRMEGETKRMLERLKLKIDSLRTRVINLSGGQRQCIAISRAIYFNAKVLIMDEPTAALGVQETERVHGLVGQLKEEGIAIALISHDLHDVFELSDRIAVLKNGVIVGIKRTSETTKDEILSMIILGIQATQSQIPLPSTS